jgi:hypothetical protein
LVHVLREHGYHVEVHKCRRLGNIVWEDDFQVAAFPSKSDDNVVSDNGPFQCPPCKVVDMACC